MVGNNLCFALYSKRISLSLIALCLLLLATCKAKPESEITAADTTEVSDMVSPSQEDEGVKVNDFIEYWGAKDNDVRKALESFSPFTTVTDLVRETINLKDSLWVARGYEQPTDPKDSLIFRPLELKAYSAILSYKKLMESGPSLEDKCPRLIDLTRTPNPVDSSLALLPDVGKSKFLSHGNFFFLGGAPFINKSATDESAVFQDPQGNPETRFMSDVTENGNYFLNSVQHFKNMPMTITDGESLEVREGTSISVNGIGSLTHTFSNRLPALILTESGLVPASIVSVRLKIASQGLGCISDQPLITFACSQSISEKDILGIYISYNTALPTSCIIQRSDLVWTVDLNNDDIADIASVSSTFAGIADDVMAEVLWFVNINGEWKIIDWGRDLDCT